LPRYDHFCRVNSPTVEVAQSISAMRRTRGEVCEAAEPGTARAAAAESRCAVGDIDRRGRTACCRLNSLPQEALKKESPHAIHDR